MNTQPIKEIARVGREVVQRRNSHDCNYGHLGPWKRQVSTAICSTLGMVVCGGIALIAFRRAMDAAHRHQEWRHADDELDDRLAESMDASDVVARY